MIIVDMVSQFYLTTTHTEVDDFVLRRVSFPEELFVPILQEDYWGNSPRIYVERKHTMWKSLVFFERIKDGIINRYNMAFFHCPTFNQIIIGPETEFLGDSESRIGSAYITSENCILDNVGIRARLFKNSADYMANMFSPLKATTYRTLLVEADMEKVMVFQETIMQISEYAFEKAYMRRTR